LFTIIVETQFKAKHSVTMHDGVKEPEHEHFWAVSAEVNSGKLNSNGMALDFALLKSKITEITSKLAGSFLNDISYFQEKGPTAENVAIYIFEQLEPVLPADVRLASVSISEQVGCIAKYHKD
jgi:6-pyruvoyltetrahydropterin/6-carboxytetrahydropterin synthase